MLERLDHGAVREIRLARPPVNAFSPEFLTELAAAVRAASAEGAGALVLSGREGMFSAGLDVPHFLTLDRDGVRAAWGAFFDVMRAVVDSPVPVAGALTGHAPAGGCVLALCCDWRVLAAGKYRIGLNEVEVGVRMPAPILAVARHAVGLRQAERLCTTAELLLPEEALRIDLVDEVVDVAEVVPRAVAWAQRMATLPPETLRATRALARRELVESFASVEGDALEGFLDAWFSDEAQGALRAVVERLAAKKKGS